LAVVSDTSKILVLGAYGLAGRAIVEQVCRTSQQTVVASGRRRDRLQKEFGARRGECLETLELDATDAAQLRRACAAVDLVINAVGPFALDGADIARTVIESGRHYVDCANEQVHYERLLELREAARSAGTLLVTGAGVIPGISTLLAGYLLDQHGAAEAVDIVWAQLCHAYPDGGRATVMGGVLDAVYRPYCIRDGERRAVSLGHSVRQADLPAPFGSRLLLEVPTLDVPVLAERAALREIHTWVHVTPQPAWVFGLIRLLNPAKRPMIYRLIDRVADRLTRAEFARATQQGLRPEALLLVSVSGAGRELRATLHFTDGAAPVGVLPARIARDLARGAIEQRGLTTPLDFYRWVDVREELQHCLLRSEVA
jgi:short subunit dehydrogenase-like uncharacterized protein